MNEEYKLIKAVINGSWYVDEIRIFPFQHDHDICDIY